jgi:hypothetical protein
MSLSNKSDLHLNWASHQAALYACQKWHYSKSLPTGKLVKIGVWENNVFIGCVLFSRGANRHFMTPYGLTQKDGAELTRIALHNHQNPVSRIVAIAIKFLKKKCPDLQLLVSYADPEEGHHGGIYQAGNWIYIGVSGSIRLKYWHKNKWRHQRSLWTLIQKNPDFVKTLKTHKTEPKHTYLMPLTSQMREKALSLAKPYPMRLKQVQVGTPDKNGGAAPTQTLQ